ncbi:MAG: CotH kinase family protein [Bacteroidota bacterium]
MRLLYTCCLLLWTIFLNAQNLFPGRGMAFQDEEVPRVDILISEADINTILAEGNEFSNVEYPATFIMTDSEEADTVTNVGFRLRGNTSRTSDKKSFKVSFNTFESQRWKGLEKLNLNGEHNDPTISRAKLAWDFLKDMRVPGARANHVALYINNEYRGLYANIEQIDEEFMDRRYGNKDGNLYKCLFPADLAYLGTNPDAYKLEENGRRTYDLKTNEEEDDYSDIANFITVLTQTSIANLSCELEQIFNVDTYLRTMAFDVLTGNWDGYYNQNNFYLYHNTATDKFEYIPFDLDNTYGIDWFGIDWTERNVYDWMNSSRPLFKRLLDVPDYRARFTYYLRSAMDDDFSAGSLFADLDELRDMLEPFVVMDDFYPQDYGFSIQDFRDGFDEELTAYNHTKEGIKSFVSARRSAGYDQLEDLDPAPYISSPRSNVPSVGQDFSFQAVVVDNGIITEVEVCYQINGGSFVCRTMTDEGTAGDGMEDDDEYGAFVSALSEAASVSWYITATDAQGMTNRLPVCGTFSFTVQDIGPGLAINEIMASNDGTIADEFDEFDDWVEIHNYSNASISLSGLYLSDNPDNPTKWAFPSVSIPAGAFIVVWCDDDEEQGPLHTTFKLSADGEFIGIFDTDANGNSLIDGIEFSEQEGDLAIGRVPNGTGPFQNVVPTPGQSNQPLNTQENGLRTVPFVLAPNPARDYVQLLAPYAGTFTAHLTDMTGKLVATRQWTGLREDWPLSVPNGLYLLWVSENGLPVFSTKIVKR